MTLKELLTIDTSNPAAWAEHDAEVAIQEAEQKKARAYAEYKKIVPERYWNVSLNNYQAAPGSEQARAWECVAQYTNSVLQGGRSNLILLGPAGVGKTHLACGILREVGGSYLNASEIVDDLHRAKSFTAKETESQRLKRYAEYKLLVVDEVGRGGKSDDEKLAIYQLINARYNANRPTVLISNFNRATFIDYLGAATFDRLIEAVQLFAFNENVPSYRAVRAQGGK